MLIISIHEMELNYQNSENCSRHLNKTGQKCPFLGPIWPIMAHLLQLLRSKPFIFGWICWFQRCGPPLNVVFLSFGNRCFDTVPVIAKLVALCPWDIGTWWECIRCFVVELLLWVRPVLTLFSTLQMSSIIHGINPFNSFPMRFLVLLYNMTP